MNNKKKKGIIILWISLFTLFTFLVFFIIGTHTDFLVKNVYKIIALVLTILSFITVILGIYLIIKKIYLHHLLLKILLKKIIEN